MLSPFFGSGLELIVTYPLLNDKRKKEVLESVVARFLAPGTLFYQYYADSVHLYNAISFGHPAFAKFLLIPALMEYLTDCWKSSWGDYGHVLRTVDVLSSPCASVIELPLVDRKTRTSSGILFERCSSTEPHFGRVAKVCRCELLASGILEDPNCDSNTNWKGG